MEDLAASKEKFYHNEVKRHDRIEQLRRQLSDANNDFEDTNKALDILKQAQSIQYDRKTFNGEPQLNDFYQLSHEMEEYQYITIGIIAIDSCYL